MNFAYLEHHFSAFLAIFIVAFSDFPANQRLPEKAVFSGKSGGKASVACCGR
jgi:hypothetical protein